MAQTGTGMFVLIFNRKINTPPCSESSLYFGLCLVATKMSPCLYSTCRRPRPEGFPFLPIAAAPDAMESIFLSIEEGKLVWIASTILVKELRKNPDVQRRENGLGMLKFAAEVRSSSNFVARRAKMLEALGYGALDAFHLAFAEDAPVDLLVTTDDRFLGKIARGLGNPAIQAANSLDWIRGRAP